MKPSQVVLITFTLLVILSTTAHAGELHTQYFGLMTALKNTGPAVLGTVAAINHSKGTLTLIVKKYWAQPGQLPTLKQLEIQDGPKTKNGQRITSIPIEIGKPLTLTVHLGVNWTDPDDSPNDQRLQGHLEFKSVKTNQDVIYIGQELLSPTSALVDRLSRVTSANFKEDYPSKMTDAVLTADLEDFDLSTQAFSELLKRKKANLKTLMSMKDTELAGRLIPRLIELSKQDSSVKLHEQAQTEVLSKNDAFLKVRVLRNLFSKLENETYDRYENFASLLLVVLTKYDPQLEASENYPVRKSAYDIARNFLPTASPQLTQVKAADSPIYELFWVVQLQRLKDNSTYDISAEAQEFTQHSRPSSLTHLSLVGLRLFSDSARNKTKKLETYYKTQLDCLQKLIAENPDQSLAESIRKLPILELKNSDDQIFVLQRLIQMAVSLAQKNTSAVAFFKPQFKKVLAAKVTISDPIKPDKIIQTTLGAALSFRQNSKFAGYDQYLKLFGQQPI